jgi:hypothetical protein
MQTLRAGHQLQLLQGAQAFFPALVDAIDRSVLEVRLETYIFNAEGSGADVAAALEQIAAMNASEGTTAAPATKASTTLHADVDAAEDDFYALRIENHERRLAELADSNDALPPPADPRPLPFGRVYSGICEIDVPQYYYVRRWFFFFKSFAFLDLSHSI